jgi:hypothetical protein
MVDKILHSYCSWCFKYCEHRLVDQNILSRNEYECISCRHKTLQCRYCLHMAKSGKWDNELCAEHDGSIASFNRLDLQLVDITEYKKIFIRESRNLKKIGTISALSLGGAISIGPCAFLAAPAIGGVVGAAMGLSGVAATNAGLAAIGGGALAAGGFGMAGGAAILGATGAALGGTLGGVISNSYFGDIS